jgi:hypothetical protein
MFRGCHVSMGSIAALFWDLWYYKGAGAAHPWPHPHTFPYTTHTIPPISIHNIILFPLAQIFPMPITFNTWHDFFPRPIDPPRQALTRRAMSPPPATRSIPVSRSAHNSPLLLLYASPALYPALTDGDAR